MGGYPFRLEKVCCVHSWEVSFKAIFAIDCYGKECWPACHSSCLLVLDYFIPARCYFLFFMTIIIKISINSWGENIHKYILRLVPMIQLISWEFCLIMLPMLLIMHIACDLPNQFMLALVTSRGIAGMGWFHRNMGCTYPNIKGRVL